MIRYFVLLFNMIGIFIFRLFFADDVSVTQTAPSKVNPGDEFTVEIIIKKGTLGGFAQLKCEIPEGFTAAQGEVSGSEFKFSGQIVRFTWTALPGDPQVKVSYKVKVGSGVAGVKSLTGKFSFVVNNVKTSVEMNAASVTVGSPVTETIESTPTTTTTANNPPPPDTAKTTAGDNNKNLAPTAVSVVRQLPATAKAGDEITVQVTINKGNLKGFARFQDVLPDGLTASAGDSKGGTFSFLDQKIKIVWDNIPAETQVIITYKISIPKTASGDQSIEGVFSYVENDEPKKVPVAPSVIAVSKSPETTVVNNNIAPPDTGKKTNVVVNNNPPPDTSSKKQVVANVTPPSKGVNYKVQICAAHNTVNTVYFKNKYSISEKINIENHEGWVKYTTGAFTIYKDARDHRETIRGKGVEGPFVTAYNAGKRITVQEALMISSQQWYR